MNLVELNDLDEDTRIEIEGFQTGTYLRLEIHNVPYEMVDFFDPNHPVLVGGIGFGEDNVGFMQVWLQTKFFISDPKESRTEQFVSSHKMTYLFHIKN